MIFIFSTALEITYTTILKFGVGKFYLFLLEFIVWIVFYFVCYKKSPRLHLFEQKTMLYLNVF